MFKEDKLKKVEKEKKRWIEDLSKILCKTWEASTPTRDMTRKVIDSYQKAILLHQRLATGEKK
jgi:hypothetical protein